MMALTSEQLQFREELRTYIRENLPVDIKHKVENNLAVHKDDHVRWQTILREKGWYGGSWPREYGGLNWSVVEQYLFDQENALAGAPFIIPYGVNMVGPVIYTFGNAEQKAEYLPDILANRTWWCQGYSEPNAGSDLASLKCSARRDGDHYVINGTKMWTTQAQDADMMHILVRTSDDGPKQAGITFLLLDMNTAGIRISPITTIDGLKHTNQTFFDEVRVPVSNRVGEEGKGWEIAKFLLAHERTAIAYTGVKRRLLESIKLKLSELALDTGRKTLFSLSLAELEIRLTSLIALEQRLISKWQSGKQLAHEASALKVRATELEQQISVLAGEILGPYKGTYDLERVDRGENLVEATPAQNAAGAGHLYLYGRCSTIYGGTNQIQRNIVAKAMLKTRH